jgi:poly[(R)-3-hydroxyalkanoate] polymerase subunit PhaC
MNSNLSALWRFYERTDRVRVGQGKWLESLGWGPEETPSRIVLQLPDLTLKGYAGAAGHGPLILLVPAPIKRSYIWDLAPEASVVRACLKRGLRPYLVHWERPDPAVGLVHYGDIYLSQCLEAIRLECGDLPVILAGHSMGGLFTAIFAALHPTLVAGLVLLASPLHFSYSRKDGALGPVIETMVARGLLATMPSRMPGSLLSQTGFMASPAAFGRERWEDWLYSLPESKTMRTHMQVERWSLDEFPLARALVEDLVNRLYREDGFIRGTLRFGERTVAASQVVAPLLLVLDSNCPVVPPTTMLPFHEAAASAEKRLLWYEGDVGVAIRHLGPLVGRNAQARLWPQILEWIHSQWPAAA